MNKQRHIIICGLFLLILLITMILCEPFLLGILSSKIIFKKIVISLLQPAPLTALLTLVFGFYIAYPEFIKIKKKAETDYIVEKIKESEKLVYRHIPMLVEASYLLSRRIEKILHKESKEYTALNKNFSIIENWSMTFSYQTNSLLYYFACWFAWAKLVSDEVFCSYYIYEEERNIVNNSIVECMNAISNHYRKDELPEPLDEEDKDVQVFKNYQNAIGSVMIKNSNISEGVISFIEFERIIEKEEFKSYIRPIQDLLKNIRPGEYRWKRLISYLYNVNILCEVLSDVQNILKNRLLKIEISEYKLIKDEMINLGNKYKIDYKFLSETLNHTKRCPYDKIDLEQAINVRKRIE